MDKGRYIAVVPWEAYRAHIGVRFAKVLSETDGRWILDGGAFHESDHAASATPTDFYGLSRYDFPNGSISTFEYLSLRLTRETGSKVLWRFGQGPG